MVSFRAATASLGTVLLTSLSVAAPGTAYAFNPNTTSSTAQNSTFEKPISEASSAPGVGNNPVKAARQAGKRSLLESPQAVAGKTKATIISVLVDDGNGHLRLRREKTDSRSDTLSTIRQKQKQDSTVAVSVDHPVHALGMPSQNPAQKQAFSPSIVPAASYPDPLLSYQYAHQKFDTFGAWNKNLGAGVRVAVLDTGVDRLQEDLLGRVSSDIDLNSVSLKAGTDNNGHGTHVAGIIAATYNNGLGGAGVAPKSTIVPVKVLDDNGEGTSSIVSNGIIWATEHNVQVINLSLGSPDYDAVQEASIKYALANRVIVVAAAGNDGPTTKDKTYPAAYSGVLAVAASGFDNVVASYSSAGSYVSVTAPGSYIMSTWPGNSYQTESGTSMAAPYVAGIAADLLATKPGIYPSYVADEIKKTATDIETAGFDNKSGWGFVNPTAAELAIRNVTVTGPPKNPGSSLVSFTSAGWDRNRPARGVNGYATAMASVRDQSNGKAIPGAQVTFLADEIAGKEIKATAITDKNGSASVKFKIRMQTQLYVETKPSPGKYFGSEDYSGEISKQTVKAHAKARRHQVALSVSPNTGQKVKLQIRTFHSGPVSTWRNLWVTNTHRINQYHLNHKKVYRVKVYKAYYHLARWDSTITNSFRG